MNTKTIVVTLSVIGGLIGLTLLANCFVQEAPPVGHDEKPKAPLPEKKQSEQKTESANPLKTAPEIEVDKTEPIKSNEPQNDPKADLDSFTLQENEVHQNSESIVTMAVNKEEPQVIGDEFPLRLGSKGPKVERLQVFLLRNYGHTGKVTGLFDELTALELKRRLNKTQLDEATYQKYRMGKHVHEQVIIR